MPSEELSFETICDTAGVPRDATATAFDWTSDGIRIEYDLPEYEEEHV